MYRLGFDYTTNVEGVGTKKTNHVWFFCFCFFGYRAQILGEQMFSWRDSFFFSWESMSHVSWQVFGNSNKRDPSKTPTSDGDFVGVDSWTPEVSWFHWQILERSCWNWPLKEAWTADKCQETWASVLNLGLETRILFYKKGKWYQLSWGYTPQFNRPLFFFPYVCLLFFCLSWDANPLPATVTTRMTLHIYTYNRRKMEGILNKTFTCYREMENPEVEVQ